jgi:hypothetical protein
VVHEELKHENEAEKVKDSSEVITNVQSEQESAKKETEKFVQK